jgi:tetratricopeptide (TPR) repeat protein
MDAGASPAAGPGVFVGREGELATLGACVAEAAAGRGGFVAIAGEPGIGKTRLLEELVARAALPDERVLWGRCLAHEGVPAYWPWTQALRSYVERSEPAALRGELGPAGADVAQLVPEVRERVPELGTAPRLDPEQARFRLFDSVASFLRRASARRPLLVVLEDLHWADEVSMLLLGFVAPELRRTGVLVAGTYREVEIRRRPRHGGTIAQAAVRLVLRGLERPETAAFVQRSVGVAVPERVVADLHRITEGNPYFLGELVRDLRTRGRTAGAELPPEVREAIRRRLEPLDGADRRLLAIAAVMGREFDLPPLAIACEEPPDRVLGRLAAAVEAGLVGDVPSLPGRFRFTHALVRETLYEDLAAPARAELHRVVALALERLYASAVDPPLAELAHHFFHAAPLAGAEHAVEYAVRAAERAVALLAYEEAVRHYQRALEALALGVPDEARRLALLLALGDAHWRAGENEQAREAFARALDAARLLDLPPAMARAALGFGRASPERGAVDPTLVAMLEEALAALGEGDSALHAALLARLASALYFTRAEERREALSRRAVEMARRVGDPGALVAALITRHFMLWGPGPIAERLTLMEEAAAVADALADRQPSFEIQRNRIFDLYEAGDVTAADLELETYARRAAAVRLPMYRWHAVVVRAMRLFMAGRMDEAERVAMEAMATRPDGPFSARGQMYVILLFAICREQGRLAELEEPLALLAGAFPAVPVWRCGQALSHAELGRPGAARALVAPLAARDLADLPRDGNFIAALVMLAELAALAENERLAGLVYPLLLPFAARTAMIGMSAACYGSAARYLGLLATVLRRPEDASRHFEEALAMNVRLGARPLVAWTRADWARLLLELGGRADRTRAGELLGLAERTAVELGMARLRARIARMPREVAAAPATPPPAGQSAVLRRDGSGWIVGYGERSFVLPDMKGLAYLATLVASPGREFHALDLAGAGDTGDAGEMLDAEAKARYRARLVELREELEEAQGFDDVERAARAEQEIDFLTEELGRAVGLGGRTRRAGSAAERARLNVGRAIASALRRIAAQERALGEHLTATVRTGLFCSYNPDPRLVVRWQL